MNKSYDDLINMTRPVSKNHIPMNILDRAAQFAPFSALNGHNDAILEKARHVEDFISLDESQIDAINYELNYIINNFNSIENVFIKYFVQDEKKQGGRYETKKQSIKKIDIYSNIIILNDNTKINFNNIVQLKVINDTEE